MRKQRLNYFLVIYEAHILLQQIELIKIIIKFYNVELISETVDDIKYFTCFRYYIIVNPHIDERYNWNIFINELITNADEQSASIVNFIDTKWMNYDMI